MSNDLNILFLSLDQSLLGSNKSGDTLIRLQAYRKHVHSITVIVPTTKTTRSVPTTSNISILSAFSRHKLFAYLKLFHQTKKTIHHKQINIITCNDPVLSFIASIVCLTTNQSTKVEVNILGNRLANRSWFFERWYHPGLWLVHFVAIHLADHIRTDNTGDAKFLQAKLGISPKKISTIPMVPSQKSQQKFINTKPNIKYRKSLVGGNKMLLSIGTLTKNKDFSNLIHAIPTVVQHHQNTTFVIVGKGPEKQHLVNLAKKLQISKYIKHLSTVNYQDLPKLYANADIYILPSNQEGLPRVLMEAALCKCPIITTDIYGAADIVVDKKSGLIVPKQSPQKLANAIIQSLSHPTQTKSYAQIAYQHTLKYIDFDTNIRNLINSWDQLIINH